MDSNVCRGKHAQAGLTLEVVVVVAAAL